MIHVYQYGAVGDGKTDDTQAIRDAIGAGQKTGQSVHLDARVYAVSQEIAITQPVSLVGTPHTGAKGMATLRALSPMRSVVSLAAKVSVRDLRTDGARRATHGLALVGCHDSRFDGLLISGALRDGVRLFARRDNGKASINDNDTWAKCEFAANGTLTCTDTLAAEFVGHFLHPSQVQSDPDAVAAFALGSNVVTLSHGEPRPGDPLLLGTGTERRYTVVIKVVGTGVVEVAQPLDYTAQGAPYALCSGDGYHEERHADNNLGGFHDCLARSNAGFGLAFDGLYGPRVIGGRVEYAPTWGVRLGLVGSQPVLCPYFAGTYFEAIGSKKPWLMRATQGGGVYHPMDWEYMDDPIEYLGNKSNCFGRYYSQRGKRPIGAAYGTGGAQ